MTCGHAQWTNPIIIHPNIAAMCWYKVKASLEKRFCHWESPWTKPPYKTVPFFLSLALALSLSLSSHLMTQTIEMFHRRSDSTRRKSSKCSENKSNQKYPLVYHLSPAVISHSLSLFLQRHNHTGGEKQWLTTWWQLTLLQMMSLHVCDVTVENGGMPESSLIVCDVTSYSHYVLFPWWIKIETGNKKRCISCRLFR